MSMKLAVPTNPLYTPLVANAQRVCDDRGWTLIRASEDECASLMLRNMVDAALLTPYGYGVAVSKVDYRIVPAPMMMAHDYTNIAGVWFREHCHDVRTIASSAPRDFMMMIGSIVLSEKFEIVADLQHTSLPFAEAITSIDALVEWARDTVAPTLDITEEWSDLVETPLPLAFWVTRMDNEDIDAVQDAFVSMADASASQEREITEVVPTEGDHFPREGRISFRWSDDVEEALFATLQILFFHQHFPELPAVKILGRD
ncbi:MAG: hypothetical protein JSS89_09855 [Bacteroidetes bacterium]|nr:hypothetical protein [Bacteroidota bacterium]